MSEQSSTFTPRAGINTVILSGHLGKAPEMRYTPTGKNVTSFSIAVNDVWSDATGKPVTHTNWVKIEVWGKSAENCSQYLVKGQEVTIEGRLRMETVGEGEATKFYTKVVADRVHFGRKPNGAHSEAPAEAVDEEVIPY